MKICHVITGLSVGGAEMMLLKLLTHRQRPDLEYAVISLMADGPLAAQMVSAGIPVHSLNMRRGIPSPLDLRRLARLTRDMAPDVAQGWMYHGNLAALLMSRMSHTPIRVLWNVRHSLSDLAHEKWLTRQVIRWGARLSSRAERILYNSEVAADQHEGLGYDPSKRLIIPNGFDVERLRPMPGMRDQIRAHYRIPPRAFVIGMVARYHPMKDFATLLQAARRHLKEYPDTTFLLAGRGVDHNNPEIMRWIDADMESRIHLLGEQDRVEHLMNAMDVFCLSSAWGDAFSNVLGEAMSCGVPCVATDVGDARHIIGDTGHIVEVRSPEDLCRAWSCCRAESPEQLRRRGAAARQRIEEHYRIEHIVSRYEAAYAAK
jgi:glycosyltransferase involved in cell wall biosynthesis